MSLLLGNARELVERRKTARGEAAVQKFVTKIEEKFGAEKTVSIEDIKSVAQDTTAKNK